MHVSQNRPACHAVACEARRRVKVLHIVRTFDLSGRSRMIRDLCIGLAPHFESTVVCLAGRAGYRPADVDLVELDLPQEGFSMHGLMKLGKYAGERRAHILHGHGAGAAAYAAGARLLHRRTRLVHTVHRADGDSISARAVVRDPAIKAMDAIVAVSRMAADQFAATNHAKPDRIQVIHNGIDPARFTFHRPHELTNSRTNKSTITLGAVMNLSPDKDFTTLLDGLALLRKTCPQARLQIAGSGPAEHEVKAYAKESGVEDRVDFLGFRNDIEELLQGFDVLVHAAHTEGLGIAILEAMAAGVPVVASRVGGIPEIMREDETGLMFEAGDCAGLCSAVTALLDDAKMRQGMIHAARQEVEARFTVEAMCRQYGEAYQALD